MLRVVLVGWGAIGRTVAEMVTTGSYADRLTLAAIAVRDRSAARAGVPDGTNIIDEPGALVDARPDLVIEAAGQGSVEPWGAAALAAGADYVVSSVSAFADADVLDRLTRMASASDAQLIIQPGALAGVQALNAARHMGVDTVEHRIIKPPLAWADTPAETLCDLDALVEPTEFFRSTAPKTAAQFPKNANVAMTTALAGIGVEATQIVLVADPTTDTNRHEVRASGPFGELDVAIANQPLPANPKTSALAALSLVRLIENRVAPIVI